MATARQTKRATVEDLHKTPDKAELVGGELVLMPPTGGKPGFAAGEIFASLREYARRTGHGQAIADNTGYVVQLPHRESLSPDAAFWVGEEPSMKFYAGAPAFAVEVRSEGDYGPPAERAIAAKRADYFSAGTQVVWDVDLLSEDVVRVYRCDDPDKPTVYGRGDQAEAEPAVPGWTMAVEDLFFRTVGGEI